MEPSLNDENISPGIREFQVCGIPAVKTCRAIVLAEKSGLKIDAVQILKSKLFQTGKVSSRSAKQVHNPGLLVPLESTKGCHSIPEFRNFLLFRFEAFVGGLPPFVATG